MDCWTEGGTVYTNAAAQEKALASGQWHPLTINAAPSVEEDQILTKHYYLEDDTIILDWLVADTTPGLDANNE